MNILPWFRLIWKFCADSQNRDPSVDWDSTDLLPVPAYCLCRERLVEWLCDACGIFKIAARGHFSGANPIRIQIRNRLHRSSWRTIEFLHGLGIGSWSPKLGEWVHHLYAITNITSESTEENRVWRVGKFSSASGTQERRELAVRERVSTAEC